MGAANAGQLEDFIRRLKKGDINDDQKMTVLIHRTGITGDDVAVQHNNRLFRGTTTDNTDLTEGTLMQQMSEAAMSAGEIGAFLHKEGYAIKAIVIAHMNGGFSTMMTLWAR